MIFFLFFFNVSCLSKPLAIAKTNPRQDYKIFSWGRKQQRYIDIPRDKRFFVFRRGMEKKKKIILISIIHSYYHDERGKLKIVSLWGGQIIRFIFGTHCVNVSGLLTLLLSSTFNRDFSSRLLWYTFLCPLSWNVSPTILNDNTPGFFIFFFGCAMCDPLVDDNETMLRKRSLWFIRSLVYPNQSLTVLNDFPPELCSRINIQSTFS